MSNHSIRGGFAGKILRINLSDYTIKMEDSYDYISRYIGGRMVASAILFNEVPIGTHWNDEQNPLIFSPGSLVGTLLPAACRVSVDTVHAFNGGKGSGNLGGSWGPELKYAGFDHIVITGKSEKPVYILISDNQVEIKDAKHLWGLTTSESLSSIRQELSDKRIKVLAIGPSGENLVRGSGIVGSPGGKIASGSGVGSVMGSKKLKAIAVRGTGSIEVANPQEFQESVDMVLQRVYQSEFFAGWRKGIIAAKFSPDSPLWDSFGSWKNGQDDYVPKEVRDEMVNDSSGVPSYIDKMMSCHSCPIGCLPMLKVPEYGSALSFWINTCTFSTKMGLSNPKNAIIFAKECTESGIDGDMCSNVIGWAMECYEKGLLTKYDTDGLELQWGNFDQIMSLLRKIVYREGFGELLSEGVYRASKILGKGSDYFALHNKQQDILDPCRIVKGWGFAVSMSPLGGKHLRGSISAPNQTGPGPELPWSPYEYKNVPDACFWQQMTKEIEDAIGNCVFCGTWSGVHSLTVPLYARILNSGMGFSFDEESLLKQARVGINLEKAFNTLHTDFDRNDDLPPRRYRTEPVKEGPFKGAICDEDEWNKMLTRYYELNEWSRDTGKPTYDSLISLGLKDVADKLVENEKIDRHMV